MGLERRGVETNIVGSFIKMISFREEFAEVAFPGIIEFESWYNKNLGLDFNYLNTWAVYA